MKKTLAIILAFVLIVGATVAGTVAYLVDDTETITNTFTVGDITIDLTETWNAKSDPKLDANDIWKGTVVPGTPLAKDPKVIVKAGSEACWLFVKLEKVNWPADPAGSKITYSVREGWTELTEGSGIYYRQVDASEATKNVEFDVLADNTVYVDATLKKSEVSNLGQFQLNITAYAVQQANVADATAAWDIAKDSANY